MLKTKEGRVAGPVPRWGRTLAVLLLAAAVVGVAALRCPAQKAADPQQAPVASPEYSPAERFFAGGFRSLRGLAFRGAGQELAVEAPEPFDLSYLPPDVMGVVCFRPSAVLGRPGLKKYADAANKAIAEECEAVELPRAFGLRVEEIEQAVLAFSVKTNKEAKGPQSALMLGTPAMFRATKDFDWAKELKDLLPAVKEVRRHGEVIYQLPTDGPLAAMNGGIKMCCYVPDARTVVFDTEERLVQMLGRKASDVPAWAADFRRVERGLAAVVLDNRNGAWARELAARDEPEPHIAPFQAHTSWVVVGFSADDGFVCDASARFDDVETAEKAVKAIDGGLAAARTALATPEAFPAATRDEDDAPDADKRTTNADDTLYTFAKALVQDPELKREGASVRLRCRAKCDDAQVFNFWLRFLQ
jgi:hypothetical protein